MKKNFFVLILMICSVFCFAGENQEAEKSTLTDEQIGVFQRYLGEIVQAYHIPGMAFFITDSERTIYSQNFGQCRNLDQNFFVGSNSKSYTALAIMQLVEKGLINLDDDISVYLPDYTFNKKIAILSLLNHTSGFDAHAKLHNAKITKSYGKYEYSNVNYDLLGKIIEKVSGISYEQYIQQNIFLPLGMTNSKAKAELLKGDKNLLLGNRNYFGFFVKGDADYPKQKSWFHEPAGFLVLTPNEHAKYLRMYLNDGLSENNTQIITKESINSMWYQNVPLGPKETVCYGKGWNYMNYDGLEIIFHGGQVENYISYSFILPQKNLAVCFMVNGNDEFGMNALMDNAFWDSLSILQGRSPKKVNHFSYVLIHLVLNAIYLFIVALSVFILIKSNHPAQKSETKKSGTTKGKVKSIVLQILAYFVWPVFLLTFTKVFVDTPLWVVKSYVPDLFLVIIIGSTISVMGGIWKSAKNLI